MPKIIFFSLLHIFFFEDASCFIYLFIFEKIGIDIDVSHLLWIVESYFL